MSKNNITLREAAQIVSRAAGEEITARRILYWSKNRTGEFPPLALALQPKFFRLDREKVENWTERNFGSRKLKTEKARNVG